MAAEFIGLESINENLEKFSFDAIGVFDKKLEKFKRIANEGESEEDLILAFNRWAESMLDSNPMNFKTYAIQLYDNPEGAKKLKGTISFTFALVKPIAQNKQSESKPMEGFITKNELNLALENQRLEFEKTLLEKRLLEIESEDEFEDEFEDETEQSLSGVMQQQLIGRLPQLIDLAIASLMPNQQAQNRAVMSGTIDEIIAEFKLINPDIESDLQKLLNVAKTNPQLFNMLISQLRSM